MPVALVRPGAGSGQPSTLDAPCLQGILSEEKRRSFETKELLELSSNLGSASHCDLSDQLLDLSQTFLKWKNYLRICNNNISNFLDFTIA